MSNLANINIKREEGSNGYLLSVNCREDEQSSYLGYIKLTALMVTNIKKLRSILVEANREEHNGITEIVASTNGFDVVRDLRAQEKQYDYSTTSAGRIGKDTYEAVKGPDPDNYTGKGYVPIEDNFSGSYFTDNYGECQSTGSGKVVVSVDKFKFTVKHKVLDHIFETPEISIDEIAEVYYQPVLTDEQWRIDRLNPWQVYSSVEEAERDFREVDIQMFIDNEISDHSYTVPISDIDGGILRRTSKYRLIRGGRDHKGLYVILEDFGDRRLSKYMEAETATSYLSMGDKEFNQRASRRIEENDLPL